MSTILKKAQGFSKERFKSTPAVADIYYYLKYPYGANLYKGVYEGFKEAKNSIPSKFRSDYDIQEAHHKPNRDLSLFRPINTPLLEPFETALKDISSVLDIGGGVGIDYYAFKQALDFSESLSWMVYDVPIAVKVGQDIATRNHCPNLSFITDLKQTKSVDLLLTNGALQYLDQSLSELIDQLPHKPKHLLVNYIPCYDGNTFFTIQNLKFSRCPYKIQGRTQFIHDLEVQGYQLVKSWEEPRTCLIPFHPDQFVSSYFGFYFTKK
ncbi:methyltransferase, TIGR04325 family [Acaryochloris marina]|uniref:methyltransferase, TIGR04325 family n=1 Tax=Acaryochloris marina TaxID=155978 RepID=UPI001BAEB1AA|nr:methyltransferase, TIGR04325 family [Acaryochloris marina]QUY44991.1 methyltransferase, TIGR04325 family [Acaryochloris marina S15]